MGEKKGHAIMISIPYQGHINPLVNLALKLASKGITVTSAHLEFVHHKLSEVHNSKGSEIELFSEARQSGLDIRYTTIGDGFPLEFDRDAHFEDYWDALLRDFGGLVDEFVGKIIRSDPDTIHFLVSDTFYHWPAPVADKYKLVYVALWTQPALVLSLLYHWDLFEQNGHFPCKDDADEEIDYVPGVESISTRDLPTILKESGSSTVLVKNDRIAFEGVKKADFILHNIVHELESETLLALNTHQPNYAIGPISFSQNIATYSAINMSLWSESDCTHWLKSKSPASVLYVSFGSFIHTDKQIIEELAYGLLLSEVNFIWVIRHGILKDGSSDVFPDGFLDEIKDSALIFPWCNQIMVLSNPAVGGFLMHNGWNSTMESIWCGVPMICYPVAYDPPTNRKLVVDDWKIEINLCDGKSIDKKEVTKTIKSVMNGACSKSLRQEASKLKAILHNALQAGDGSSKRNFDQFIKDLKGKVHQN